MYRPDPESRPRSVATVTLVHGLDTHFKDLDEQDVIELCRVRIASFKIPCRVFFVDQFPMTGSGKIQKYLLREQAERLSAAKPTKTSGLDAAESNRNSASVRMPDPRYVANSNCVIYARMKKSSELC